MALQAPERTSTYFDASSWVGLFAFCGICVCVGAVLLQRWGQLPKTTQRTS
eukprot:CAMPEP_0180525910 /NCGR_PEP_ID=MMETSP1036_2-20121128/59412_1 /TAXON_ID=632150 /ORGANISM="Azadinium spinosum, Strain 3D9" /LENGTH=50 /DNA_ID=CAMNT_0022539225 /DNA_START=94 /DNA_END=243 /DNA_ORIENTATION=-